MSACNHSGSKRQFIEHRSIDGKAVLLLSAWCSWCGAIGRYGINGRMKYTKPGETAYLRDRVEVLTKRIKDGSLVPAKGAR